MKMERKILLERIVGFYFATGLLDETIMKKDETKIVLESCLNKPEYVEAIINTIITRAKTHKNLDIEKLKEILLELEKIRLELEYKDHAKLA